jgi:hypothetical protein
MMFAFASSLGIAKSKGMDLIVKKSKLTNIFKMKVKTSDNMSECRGSKILQSPVKTQRQTSYYQFPCQSDTLDKFYFEAFWICFQEVLLSA